MKILYFSPHPHVNMAAPSGPGTHIREVIRGFENSGHEVIRFIAGGEHIEGNQAIQIKQRAWKKFIPEYIWQSLKDYSLLRLDRQLQQQLEALIAKEKPDVIYERAYYLMGAGYRAAQSTNTPYFCEINAPYPEEKSEMNGTSIFHRRSELNEKSQVEATRKTFVVSTALKQYLTDRVKGSENKIIVTPNAVNPANIHIQSEKVAAIRKKLNAGAQDLVVGFVGSIFPYHGVDLLISAFSTLVKKGQNNLRLLIVGDGEILGQLKTTVKQSGLEHMVLFTGNVPHREVYDYIEAMDITVMARSNWYGSPVKIFEYGVMNKGIIAPDVVPVRDVMKHGEDGLLIPDDESALVDALTFMTEDMSSTKAMAQHFCNQVKQHHTWQHVSDKILEAMK
ncbi:MAG: glycosyltransferase family 4 protein [Flavobacteriales bacterium]|nr:glycosyltransferase family 4 protein [Flavobacteriales bacterium]